MSLAQRKENLEGLGFRIPDLVDGPRAGQVNPYEIDYAALVEQGRVSPLKHYLLCAAIFPSDFQRGDGIDGGKQEDGARATYFEVLRVGAETDAIEPGDVVTFIAAAPDFVDPTGVDRRHVFVHVDDARSTVDLKDLTPDAPL